MKLPARPIIIDTDIGTDVDDLLALVLVANSPDFDVVGVTTVDGDTHLRAKIARHILNLLGKHAVPVIPGAGESSGGPCSWAGHEGAGIPELDKLILPAVPSATKFLIDSAEKYAGQLEILAIAPLTNLANAMSTQPRFYRHLKHLFLMGGSYWLPHAEHNFQADPPSANLVFQPALERTAIGLDVTLQVEIRQNDLQAIQEGSPGLGPLIADQTRRWLRYLKRDYCHLHDPLAFVAMKHPECFKFEHAQVSVMAEGKTQLSKIPGAMTRVAKEVTVDQARDLILNGLKAGI